MFLAAQPDIEKLINVELQDMHQSALKNPSEANSRFAIEQLAFNTSPGKLPLYTINEGIGFASLYEIALTNVGKTIAHQEIVQLTTLA